MRLKPGSLFHDFEDTHRSEEGETSVLERTIRHHRSTPTEKLSGEALRFLLEEEESIEVLLRAAIDRLERNPFLSGDFHTGDLLVAVLRRPDGDWVAAPDLRARAFALAQDAGELLDTLEPTDRAIVRAAIAGFQYRWSHGGAWA